jgi:hypothetical protein
VSRLYTAYATLADGTSLRTSFWLRKRAVAHAELTRRQGGACFVVRGGRDSKVVYNTHESLEAVLTHAGRVVQPKGGVLNQL